MPEHDIFNGKLSHNSSDPIEDAQQGRSFVLHHSNRQSSEAVHQAHGLIDTISAYFLHQRDDAFAHCSRFNLNVEVNVKEMREEYYELLRDEKDLLHTEIDMYKSSIADKEDELKRKDEKYNML